MKLGLSIVAAAVLTGLLTASASAQNAVPPRWNYQGSAVCPNGYDYYADQGLCISRGGYGYGRGYGGPGYGGGYGGHYGGGPGLRPQWNQYGSAVCPSGYDYVAEYNRCLPQ
jgi:hypothetical protein